MSKELFFAIQQEVWKINIRLRFSLGMTHSHELIYVVMEWMYLATKYKVEHQRENFFERVKTFASISKAWRFSKKDENSLFTQ